MGTDQGIDGPWSVPRRLFIFSMRLLLLAVLPLIVLTSSAPRGAKRIPAKANFFVKRALTSSAAPHTQSSDAMSSFTGGEKSGGNFAKRAAGGAGGGDGSNRKKAKVPGGGPKEGGGADGAGGPKEGGGNRNRNRNRNKNKGGRGPGGEGRGGGGRGPLPEGRGGGGGGVPRNDGEKIPAFPKSASAVSMESMATTASSVMTKDSSSGMKEGGGELPGHISGNRFADLQISSMTKRALADHFSYEFMTQVQAETLPPILAGKDCLAKAKTGTGKTLAFMIPAIERIRTARYSDNGKIKCLVLSPTRELAGQITSETSGLLTYDNSLRVTTVVGGTNINKDLKALRGTVDFLVATPGRLLDHLQNYELAPKMSDLDFLIFDEADQLLDMGFRPDIERVLAILRNNERPGNQRQTLLFSATFTQSIKEIAKMSLKSGYSFIDTVGEETEQTHQHVNQELVMCENKDMIHNIAGVIDREMSRNATNYKIMVFFNTARTTGYFSEFFESIGVPIHEIHSRKSQSARTKTSEAFRKADTAIMFSSDVSARGMDYPDVTFVLQVGLTEREQYIHRLGRTARAGKSGNGMLMLAPYEVNTMTRALNDMPLKQTNVDITPSVSSAVNDGLSKVDRNRGLKESAEQCYRAHLGFYNGNLKKCGWNKTQLIQEANHFARCLGLSEQPALQKKTIGKMGLKGQPGLRIEN